MSVLKWFFLSVVLVLLTACGGGGENDGTGGDNPTVVTNTPPVAKALKVQTQSDTSISGYLDVTDKEDTHFKYFIVTQPSSGTVKLDETSGFFVYTPHANFVGNDSFTYKAYDGKAYSKIQTASIEVKSITINSSDTVAPSKATILSINSPSSNKLTLFWLGSTDDKTSPSDLRYEVHCDTQKDFTPSAGTLTVTVLGSLEADVEYLQADTLYYVKVKTVDIGGNTAFSSEMNITTSEVNSAVLNTSNKVKKADDLFLHGAVTTDGIITYKKTDKTVLPDVGDILVGDSQSRTLKKITSISEADGKITLQTEKTSLSQVLSKASIETKTLLVDESTALPVKSSKSMKLASTTSITGDVTSKYQWGSGRFAIEAGQFKEKKKTSFNRMSKIIDTDDGLSISSFSGAYAAHTGRANYITIDVDHTSTNSETKIKSLKIKEITHDGSTLSKDLPFSLSVNKKDNKHWTGKLSLYPDESHVSVEPYYVTLEAEEEENNGFDDEVDITLKVFILAPDLKVESSKVYSLSVGDNAKVTATVDFTPLVETKMTLEGASLKYGKINVGGFAEKV